MFKTVCIVNTLAGVIFRGLFGSVDKIPRVQDSVHCEQVSGCLFLGRFWPVDKIPRVQDSVHCEQVSGCLFRTRF